MPDLSLGTRRTVRCSDGRTRTGTVVYINPYRIFAVLQFNFWREAFPLHRPERECMSADTHPEAHGQVYTPEEDKQILASNDLFATARKLGRTECAVQARQNILRTNKRKVPHRHFTPAEDKIILASKNLATTARELGRKDGSIWMRRETLRRRKACTTRST